MKVLFPGIPMDGARFLKLPHKSEATADRTRIESYNLSMVRLLYIASNFVLPTKQLEGEIKEGDPPIERRAIFEDSLLRSH